MTPLEEARRFAKAFIDSDKYRESLAKRILEDTLPSNMEALLWQYAFGRPVKKLTISQKVTHNLRDMSDDEFETHTQKLVAEIRRVREQKALAAAPDADFIDSTAVPNKDYDPVN